MNNNNIINGEFLIDSVANALKDRQRQGLNDQTFFHSLLKREVGLYKGEEEIYLADQMVEMFSNVTQILHEKHYPEKDSVMLRVGLPVGYRVVPARIFAADIPPQFYRQLNCQPVSPQKRDKMMYICEAINPARLAAGILERYQCITVKINKETLALKSWVPGVDLEAGYHQVDSPLILVGKHMSKQEKAAEIQRRQALGQVARKKDQDDTPLASSSSKPEVLTLADLLA